MGQLAGNHADYEVASSTSLPPLNTLANSLIREYSGSHELMIAPVISLPPYIYRYIYIRVCISSSPLIVVRDRRGNETKIDSMRSLNGRFVDVH